MIKTRTVSSESAYDTTTDMAHIPLKNQKTFRILNILVKLLFGTYTACVFYLVFLERLLHGSNSRFHRVIENVSYRKAVKQSIQPIPFQTIRNFARWLHRSSPFFRLAVINLAGNLVLFFPMGFFLPCFFKKQRNPFWFLLTMTCMISCVEVLQALTLLGKCDIDDLILNLTGAFAGFLCFHVLYLLRRMYSYARRKRK